MVWKKSAYIWRSSTASSTSRMDGLGVLFMLPITHDDTNQIATIALAEIRGQLKTICRLIRRNALIPSKQPCMFRIHWRWGSGACPNLEVTGIQSGVRRGALARIARSHPWRIPGDAGPENYDRSGMSPLEPSRGSMSIRTRLAEGGRILGSNTVRSLHRASVRDQD